MATPGAGTICLWLADNRQVGNTQFTAGEIYPAIQVRVVSGTMVNLRVFSDNGPDFIVIGVPEDDTQTVPNSWTYPPGSF